jgi:hypothetical protein
MCKEAMSVFLRPDLLASRPAVHHLRPFVQSSGPDPRTRFLRSNRPEAFISVQPTPPPRRPPNMAMKSVREAHLAAAMQISEQRVEELRRAIEMRATETGEQSDGLADAPEVPAPSPKLIVALWDQPEDQTEFWSDRLPGDCFVVPLSGSAFASAGAAAVQALDAAIAEGAHLLWLSSGVRVDAGVLDVQAVLEAAEEEQDALFVVDGGELALIPVRLLSFSRRLLNRVISGGSCLSPFGSRFTQASDRFGVPVTSAIPLDFHVVEAAEPEPAPVEKRPAVCIKTVSEKLHRVGTQRMARRTARPVSDGDDVVANKLDHLLRLYEESTVVPSHVLRQAAAQNATLPA